MRTIWIAVPALVIVALLAGCDKAPAPDTREADATAIRALEAEWAKAGMSKDVTKFVSYYTPDALVLVSEAPPMRGTEAITAGMKGAMNDGNYSITFTTAKVTVAKSGDLATTAGTFVQTATNPAGKQKMTVKGNYITCWAKQADGSWKSYLDAAMNEPAPPAPAVKKKR